MTPDKSPRKFFDVAHPGSKAPPATSRPVIAPKQTITQDPMFHEQAHAPLANPVTQSKAEDSPKPSDVPTETAQLDPAALLIQAGNFTPPKASKGIGHHVALAVMVGVLVLVCAVTYFLVSSL